MVALGDLFFGGGSAGAEGGAPGTAGIVDAGFIDTNSGSHKVAMDGNGDLRDVVTGAKVTRNTPGYHP